MRALIGRASISAGAAFLALTLGSAAVADTADGDSLIGKPWDEVVEMARGGTVNLFLPGASDSINRYMSEWVGGRLMEEYGITLNRVAVDDTAKAVGTVRGEKLAGTDDAGSVDMIWINGENFRAMKQGELLFCGYLDTLPNNKYVDWDDPSIANDFGVPVDGCEVPWNKAQFAFAYDTAVLREPPRSISELIDWIKANPGQFTYPAPPDLNGSVFIRQIFYSLVADVADLMVPFDQVTYDDLAPQTWAILNDIEPYLWRKGETYPDSIAQLNQLFAGREVSIAFNYEPAAFGLLVEEGTLPETVTTYGLKGGTIGNTNYVAIPYNSPNKAAAMVLANLLLSGEANLEKAKPEVWGAEPAITVSRLPEALEEEFANLPRHPSVVPLSELGKPLPELRRDWIRALEKGWKENVGQ